jgi:predicted lipoprotein with Yx(FWY)xxD motif
MRSSRRATSAIVLGLAVSVLISAGCAGQGATSATTKAATPSASAATVDVADTSLGRILVDHAGRTLYLFDADAGDKSTCTRECAAAWPPLIARGKPTVGGTARAALVGASKRSDGTEQVTYNGHPLYLYIQDQSPGDTTGEGIVAFGAAWYVLSPAGEQIAGTQ